VLFDIATLQCKHLYPNVILAKDNAQLLTDKTAIYVKVKWIELLNVYVCS